jgi:WXXGXW repeat (2 copies)
MQNLRLVRAVLAAFLFISVAFITAPTPAPAQIAVGVGVDIAPPAIPVYAQPACPGANYIWEPGYWAWGPGGYYWVPGTWVLAPTIGYLWTPGYWGWASGAYYWHPGYWGPTVGFYGGINYGFGYFGTGFVGGYWRGGNFFYNTAVVNVNRTVVHNTYVDKTVINRNVVNGSRTSYNGGNGGIHARPTATQTSMRRNGRPLTPEQRYHEQTAGQDRNHLATVNHGTPHTMAVQHPYSTTNRPPHFTPVTSADQRAAQPHVVAQPHAAPPAQHPAGRPPR